MSFLDGRAIRDWCRKRFQLKDDILKTVETVTENTEEGKSVDALVIKEVFQNVSDGKVLLASAITDKGVLTDATDSFATMANNIGEIQTNSGFEYPISISIFTPPKTEYQSGDLLELSGMTVYAIYADATKKDITEFCMTEPENGSVLNESITEITVRCVWDVIGTTYSVKQDISVEKPSFAIVTWADGTDEEIKAMLNAHYDGTINIYDYWKVGDERTVHLSAMEAEYVGESHVEQDVIMVLMNNGGKTLVEPLNGHTECAFIVGQKNNLIENGYMNSTDTNIGGWYSCARRTWCNETYRNALPASFRPLFKQHKNITAVGSGTAKKTSVDYFALASEKEVFGKTTQANNTAETENRQFTFYATSANRLKKAGNNGSVSNWWERSSYSGNSGFFCYAARTNAAGCSHASDTYGITTFGCI